MQSRRRLSSPEKDPSGPGPGIRRPEGSGGRGPAPVDGLRAASGADPLPRRQHTGAEAIHRALEEGAPLRLVLVQRGAVDEGISRLLPRLAQAGVEVRVTSANDLRRMGAWAGQRKSSGGDEIDSSGTAGTTGALGGLGRTKVSETTGAAGAAGSTSAAAASEEADGPLVAKILGFSGPDPGASPESWMADAHKPAWLLSGVAYPGNAGYAIRCAEVSGAAGIAFDVDYDRFRRLKALRTSMGAHRFLPVLWAPAQEVVALARAAGRRVVVIEDCGDIAPWNCDLSRPSLFVIGGEERGVPPELIDEADTVLRIPVAGFVPSYNLQAAMAMVVAELLRQKKTRP